MLKHMPAHDQVVGAASHLVLGHAAGTGHGGLFVDIVDIGRIALPFERCIGAIPSTPVQNLRGRDMPKNV
ncbi:hypothetical protein D3C78_1802020 [compost metagenome]